MDKFVFLLVILCSYHCRALPTTSTSTESKSTYLDNEDVNDYSNSNETDEDGAKDLYLIKTTVYQVGILTDAGNSSEDNSTHEQVDVTFFDPLINGSLIDITSIPLPLQTNVSATEVTGVSPDLGKLPAKQIKVTQNVSTSDPEKGVEIISNLHKLLGLNSKKNDTGKTPEKPQE